MEFIMATVIGALAASGVYLLLDSRSYTVVIGLALLTYGTNLFLFTSGRLAVNQPNIIGDLAAPHADSVPQALVLTAIVISFAATAIILSLAVRAYFESGSDQVDLPSVDLPGNTLPGDDASGERGSV